MSINASEYNSANKSHLEFAKDLVQLIKSYEKEEEIETIIDVGAGSGNVTHLMASALNHRKVFGLDIDHNMYDFANKTKTLDTIKYLLCDLSGKWSSIKRKVRKLKNNVSLVFSNDVITYIKDKPTFVSNIKRLLKKESRAYFSFPIIPDFLSKLEAKHKTLFGNFVEIPDSEQQLNVWNDLFVSEGFKIETKVEKEFVFNYKREGLISFLPFMKCAIDLVCKDNKYSELSYSIQKLLLCLFFDNVTNWKDDQVNWPIIDQLMNGQFGPDSDFKWNIVYLVVKSP